MSRRPRKGGTREAVEVLPALPQGRQAAGQLVANVQNDITIPFFNGVLQPQDDTLVARGGGRGLKIYDEIERDTHAFAMLQKRKKTLVGRDWVVEPASEDARDQEAAELVEECLTRLPFDRLCEDLLDATLKGFAIAEVVWGEREGRLVPDQVVAHDQRRFVFGPDWQPRLLTWTAMTQGVELPVRKFIVHRHGVKGNNPYGLGLGTRLFWPVLFKREGVSFWLHFLEKFAGPTVVAKTPYGTLSEESRKLLNTLANIRTSAALTVPIGTEVEFLEASRSGSVTYHDFLAYWDKQISICVTGETLTTDIGSNGSRAASQTHAEMLEQLVDSDADLLSDTLQTSLLAWIVELNLPGAGVPSVRRPRPEDQKAKADLVKAQALSRASVSEVVDQVLGQAARLPDEAADLWVRTQLEVLAFPEELLAALVASRHLYAQNAPQGSRGRATPARPEAEREGGDEEEPEPARFAAHGEAGHVCFAGEHDVVGNIRDGLLLAARELIEGRLADMRAALEAEDHPSAAARLLTAAAGWDPAPLGELLRDAMTLAALEGREAVLMEVERGARFADEPRPRPFREAIRFLEQKQPKASRAWTDFLQGQHDRAFVVAGATDLAMVQDFQAAVLRAAGTIDIREFGKSFDDIVARYGWSYRGERDWRVRTIFETNLRTSHMAGRLRQMRDPDVVRLRPFWRYLHGDTRTPKQPRPQHLSWNGLVLRGDDPWWDTHFPPNDWRCSCGVETLSEDDLVALGKTGPDPAPPALTDLVADPQTGQTVRKPKGVGLGWDYMPGDLWTKGVTPRALADDEEAVLFEGRHAVAVDRPRPLADLVAEAKPFAAELVEGAAGMSEEELAAIFLAEFGTELGLPVLFTDVAGHRIAISEELLRDRQGGWKVLKQGRAPYMRLLAEAIRDPDEIWLGVETRQPGKAREASRTVVDRRYFRTDGEVGLMVVFEADRWAWQAVTGYPLLQDNGRKPDLRNWSNRRGGKLIWERRRPG